MNNRRGFVASMVKCVVAGSTLVATIRGGITRSYAASPASPAPRLKPFSQMSAGKLRPETGWRHQVVGKIKPNTATILGTTGQRFLQIVSRHSASAWSHAVPDSLRTAQRIEWQWMVQGGPQRSSLDSKESDDFAARLYVVFDYPLDKVPWASRLGIRLARSLYKGDIPAAALCYVWHPEAAAGTLVDSPFTSRVKVIVAGNGRAQGTWFRESHDIGKDFARAFGGEYGDGVAPLAAVIVSADTDQTGGRVAASFSDITLAR